MNSDKIIKQMNREKDVTVKTKPWEKQLYKKNMKNREKVENSIIKIG